VKGWGRGDGEIEVCRASWTQKRQGQCRLIQLFAEGILTNRGGILKSVNVRCAGKGGKMETSQFLTVREVAEYVRLKPLAIYRKVKSKEIPFKRAGRSLRFDKEEIDQWMKWGRR